MADIGRPRHGAGFALQRAKEEIERLNAQVAMLSNALYGLVSSNYDGGFKAADDALHASDGDGWLATHDQQVRDKALEDAAIIGGCEAEQCRNFPDGQRVADAIRAMKGNSCTH